MKNYVSLVKVKKKSLTSIASAMLPIVHIEVPLV
jgi:hypothetical protein